MTDKETWSERRERDGRAITIYERSDRDGQIWLRWTEPGTRTLKRAKTDVRTVRDKRGRFLENAKKEARAAADAKLAELIEGARRRKVEPLTLREGVTLAFTDRGLWPNRTDRYPREVRERLDTAIKILGGDNVLWSEVTPGMIRSIYRRIFREYVEAGKPGKGYNRATKIITHFKSVADWLAGEFPEQRFPRAPKHWQKELREHWSKQGYPINTQVYREEKRHSLDEVVRIYRARYLPGVDPRARLSLVLGGRLRGGQVDRAMRSHYNPDDGIKMRRGHLGKIRIPYPSPRKRIPPITLNWRERLELERALRRGFLSDLEAAFQAGEIEDYALFPGGKLRQGKAVVRERSKKPIETSRMIEHFHDIERLAGVEVIPGRGRHGLRRFFSEFDEDAPIGEDTKDLLGGWTPGSTTRRKIYQHGERPELLEEAAKARARRLRRSDDT